MKIAMYCRVSTERQENEKTIETQIWALRKHAKEQGYEIVKEYLDDGWSGDILARPALDQLRDGAKEGLFEAILVVDHDRIARRFAYQAIVLDELEEKGLQVLSLNQPRADSAEDKVLLGFRGIFAEYERVKIAERTRRGKISKAEKGTFFGWNAPYGYRYVNEPEPHFEIFVEESEIVNLIFKLIDEGATIRGVIRKLNELKLYPRKRKRTVWSSSTVTRLLRNEVYIGKAYYNKNYAVVPLNPKLNGKYKKIKKSSRKLRPKSEWYEIKGVPAILDTKLFNRVQERLKENKAFASRNRKYEYLLAGQVYCDCGRKRIGEFTAGHTYYRCSDRIYNFPLPQQCFLKGVNAGILDNRVWKRTVELLSNPEFIKEQAEKYLDTRTASNPSQSEQEQLQRQIAKLQSEESRYLKAYGAGLMSIEKLREETNTIKNLLADLQEKLGATKEIEPMLDFDLSEFGAFLQDEVLEWDFAKKQTLLRDLLLKVTIENQTRALVKGYIPVDTQAGKMGLNAESREVQHLFTFINPCGLAYRFDHLHTLSEKFQQYANQLPQAKVDDSRTTSFNPPIKVTKGETVATKIGFVSSKNVSLDFGVYDLRAPNQASKNLTFSQIHDNEKQFAFYGICWLKEYPSEISQKLLSLPGADSVSGKTSDYCN